MDKPERKANRSTYKKLNITVLDEGTFVCLFNDIPTLERICRSLDHSSILFRDKLYEVELLDYTENNSENVAINALNSLILN